MCIRDRSWAKKIGEVQRVTFAPDAVEAVLKAAGRLPIERGMPDRIVDLIENAATFVKVSGLSSGSARKEITEADVKTCLLYTSRCV